ncbi:MAG: hypothetical protein ACR2QO_01015, partial [Acidimicrobiales bacterium]
MSARQPALIVAAPDTHDEARRYVLDTILTRWFGLDYELVVEPGTTQTRIRAAGDGATLTLDESILVGSDLDSARHVAITDRTVWAEPGPVVDGRPNVEQRFPILFGHTP